ncbi:MAG TPA: phosphatidate cytidylyltransferase [Thermodesulfobacteriota bacterium]|nr:phosphatidate cytidylyltransferase [Thermodesulfobacteriota bacterium]
MTMSNLTQRILTAVVGVPLLYFIFYLGGIPFLVLILAVIFLGEIEFFKLLEVKGVQSERELAVAFSLALGIAAYFGYFYFAVVFSFSVIITFLLALRQQDLSNTLIAISTTLFAIIYLGWFLSHAILLRNIDCNSNLKTYAETVQGLSDVGFFYIFLVVSCTFLNDTGAYFIGRWKGKRKLIPHVSPGKTVEGTIGGIISSIITGGVANLIFKAPLEYHWVILFGLVIGIVAVLGDLTESLIKRSAEAKDSGGILPGHGGILDRFDSLIFTFPVSYYMVLLYYWLHGVLVSS